MEQLIEDHEDRCSDLKLVISQFRYDAVRYAHSGHELSTFAVDNLSINCEEVEFDGTFSKKTTKKLEEVP